MKPIKGSAQIIYTLLILMLVSAALLFSYNRLFDTYELHLLDLRYRIRPPVFNIYDKIVLVEISDDSIKKIGSWPFDREYHAYIIKALHSAGAKKIIFDIFFSEEKEGDANLKAAVEEAGNVYMPYVFRTDSFPAKENEGKTLKANGYEAKLLDIFSDTCKGSGHINIIPDTDGKFRRIPPFIEYNGRMYPHLGFLAAADYMGLPVGSVEFSPGNYILFENGMRIPLDEHSNIIVNFSGKWVDTFRHYSYVDIIASYIAAIEGEKGPVDLGELKDAICFIGNTATAAPDAHPSPFESLYPGVGIHANLFNSMVYGKFIARASKLANILILCLLSIFTYFSTTRSRTIRSLLYIGGVLFLFCVFSVVIFTLSGIWIDVFYPIVATILLYLGLTFRKYIFEMHKRQLLENELSIAKNIQQSFLPKEKPKVEGIDIEAKMLTARQVGGDLYDFSGISDKKAGVMIGDVAGKGVPAALYMAKVVSEFKSYAKEYSAQETLVKLNERLVSEGGSNLFVTLCYMVFDMENMSLNFSLGGHSPILMVRNDEDEPRILDLKEGMPLGIMECPFSDGTVAIKKGDLFIVYTDGVTEAMNTRNEMFGQDKLVGIIKKKKSNNIGEIVDFILSEVRKYEGKLPQHDDITVIAVKVV